MNQNSFSRSYSDKECMIKVPALITSHSGGQTTRYIFRGEKNIRTNVNFEEGIVEVIITKTSNVKK